MSAEKLLPWEKPELPWNQSEFRGDCVEVLSTIESLNGTALHMERAVIGGDDEAAIRHYGEMEMYYKEANARLATLKIQFCRHVKDRPIRDWNFEQFKNNVILRSLDAKISATMNTSLDVHRAALMSIQKSRIFRGKEEGAP